MKVREISLTDISTKYSVCLSSYIIQVGLECFSDLMAFSENLILGLLALNVCRQSGSLYGYCNIFGYFFETVTATLANFLVVFIGTLANFMTVRVVTFTTTLASCFLNIVAICA